MIHEFITFVCLCSQLLLTYIRSIINSFISLNDKYNLSIDLLIDLNRNYYFPKKNSRSGRWMYLLPVPWEAGFGCRLSTWT